MRKVKVITGQYEIRQILDDYISPTFTVTAPHLFVKASDEATMEYILNSLSTSVFNVQECTEPMMLPYFTLN